MRCLHVVRVCDPVILSIRVKCDLLCKFGRLVAFVLLRIYNKIFTCTSLLVTLHVKL